MKAYAALSAAEDSCHAKKWAEALDSYALAFEQGSVARWANGSPTGAYAKALWLLQKANTGLAVPPARVAWFLTKCAAGAAVDPQVHLESARVHLERGAKSAAADEVRAFLRQVPLFAAIVERDAKLSVLSGIKKAITEARASFPPDRAGVLEALFGGRVAPWFLDNTAPRPTPTTARAGLEDLHGRALPESFAAWVAALDRFAIGYAVVHDWKAWNGLSSLRTWNPPFVAPPRKNAFAALFDLDSLKDDWRKRAATSTLDLVLAGAIPFGRTEFGAGEYGLFLDPSAKHDEVVRFDREKKELYVVAKDFASFVRQSTGAAGKRGGRPLPRVTSKSKALAHITRAGWIADLLNGIPQLAAIATACKRDTTALGERTVDLYWLWRLYFTAEDDLLAPLLAQAATHASRYVRDVAALIERAQKEKTKLGTIELQGARKAFRAKLGPAKQKAAATTPREQPIDRKALATRAKTATQRKAITELPDTIGAYFEGLERPEMPRSGQREFALAELLAQSLAARTSTTAKKLKETSSPSPLVFYGDLHVTGNMAFGDFVIVLGNLTVDGLLEDADEYAHLWVTGDLCAKAISCMHTCWVGGAVHTDAVVVGMKGSLGAAKGVHAKLAIRDAFDDDGFVGEVKAKHYIDTEKKAAGLAVLAKKYVEQEDDDLTLADAKALLKAIVAGKPFLR